MAATYYVKAKEGAREQGPFPMKLIEESVQAERLTEASLVRESTGDSWEPLAELRRRQKQAREDRAATAAAAAERTTRQGDRRTSRTQLVVGAVLLFVGVGASIISYESAREGGTYLVFRGLIFVGIALLISSAMKRR